LVTLPWSFASNLCAQHAPILPAPRQPVAIPDLAPARPPQHHAGAPNAGSAALHEDQNGAASAPTHAAKTRLPPLVAWHFVRQGNDAFVRAQQNAAANASQNRAHAKVTKSHHQPDHQSRQDSLVATSHRPAGAGRYVCAVITCADSDTSISAALGLARKDVLELKLAGGFVNPEAVALLDRAISKYQVSLILVLAHDQCDALQARSNGAQDALDRRLARLAPLAQKQQRSLPVALAHQQRELLMGSSRILRDLVKQDHLRIVPAVLNEQTGAITWHHRRAQELPLSPVK
jgi:carbonic anhydrase